MEFRILGPVGLWRDGYEAPLKGSKQKTLLAALLLAKGRVLTDYQLTEVLWGGETPETHQAQIYTYASRLRNHLDDSAWLARQGAGYLLRIGSATFDYHEFTRLSHAGRVALAENRYERAAELLTAALGLWRGPTLTGVTDLLTEAVRPGIDEEQIDAIENRVEAELALGQHVRLTSELIKLVSRYPLRERLRAQLMTAQYRSDQQAQAFATYQEGCRLLAEEFGVDPGHTLRRAYQAILTGDLAQRVPVPSVVHLAQPAAAAPVTATPAPVPDFTGRAEELTAVADLLDRSGHNGRTILAHGISGSGKTAFALQVARRHAAGYPDGCLFLDLRGSKDDALTPDQAINQLLDRLGVPPDAMPVHLEQRIQLYRGMMAQRRMMLILDDAASEKQVRPLATTTALSQTIVTSRRRLAALERHFAVRLDGLPCEEALDLLAEIIGRERLNLDLPAARRVVGYCAGIPLALRIVGVRLAAKSHWPVSRIADRLADEDDRLDELRLGDLDVRAGLEETFDRLDDRERAALLRMAAVEAPTLSVPHIAAALEVSEQMCESLAEHLTDVHLLDPAWIDEQGRDRYRIHPLARLLARERPAGAAHDPVPPVLAAVRGAA